MCGSVKDAGDGRGKGGSSSLKAARKHISAVNVIDVFLFSLDGRFISEIGGEDLWETIAVLSDLDSETSEDPAAAPEGGASGGRDCMLFVVLESAATVAVGTDGSCAIYDSVSFESGYAACRRIGDLYSRFIETASF